MSAEELNLLPKEAISLAGLEHKRITLIGYGNQGKAHAKNLRDSGLDIIIGARNPQTAQDDGFQVVSIAEASDADLIIIALPDDVQGDVFTKLIEPNLRDGATLGFIHGFSILYKTIEPKEGIGVVMVAPKGPGVTVRDRFKAGTGVPALLAVHQENKSTTARDIAIAWATGIGSARTGILESTFQHETETDLFGEQAIIVGGLTTLIKASFETLVSAGYPPSLAYIECCHEVKQVADIIFDKGIAEMMADISNTAEIGAYEAMDILDDSQLRSKLQTLLSNVQNGTFAKRLVTQQIKSKRKELANHEIERIGEKIRSLMLQDDE
jgi:ketol-acid reductoisomerase